jgi:hypothetical protein
MKSFPLILASLIFAFPVFAQQSNNSSDAELAKIRQKYVSSLKELLNRYIKADNIAGAAEVSRELDRVNTESAKEMPGSTSPTGAWRWVGGSTVVIGADGVTTNKGDNTKGIWHWTDETKRQFQIEWEVGFVENMTLSPNGKVLLWVSNSGKGMRADRISSPEKDARGATVKP